MGVIRKSDHKIGHFEAVSQESLGIPQISDDDSVSVNEVNQTVLSRYGVPLNRSRFRPIPTAFISGRKRLGRKKSRRFENGKELSSLAEEDEFEEVSLSDLAPNDGSSFSRLLEDVDAMKKWDDFVNSSEEAQFKIISQSATNKCTKNDDAPHTGDEAFKNITGRLRTVLKRRTPIGMLHNLETELLNFFEDTPSKVFISGAISSFERLMLHALAQYHLLLPQSFDKPPGSQRLVRVIQPKHLAYAWRACPVLMADHLKHRFEIRELH